MRSGMTVVAGVQFDIASSIGARESANESLAG